MKRLILVAFALSFCVMANAQFRSHRDFYSDAYDVASAIIAAEENYNLNNIRFDENALRESPEVWNTYQQYLLRNESYLAKARKYKIVLWTGVGVGIAGMIPILVSGFGDYDSSVPATNNGVGIVTLF